MPGRDPHRNRRFACRNKADPVDHIDGRAWKCGQQFTDDLVDLPLSHWLVSFVLEALDRFATFLAANDTKEIDHRSTIVALRERGRRERLGSNSDSNFGFHDQPPETGGIRATSSVFWNISESEAKVPLRVSRVELRNFSMPGNRSARSDHTSSDVA